MRKIKVIKLDDREVTAKELRVKDIKSVFSGTEDKKLIDHLPLVTDLSPAEIDDLAPSELAVVWEAVKEVNSDFLDLMTRTGVMEKIEKAAMGILIGQSAG